MKKKKDERSEEEKRSYTMSRIHGKDTSIEIRLRKALWHNGVRYRVNDRRLPGCPDIAITKYKIAVFCDGEFWHGKNWESKKGTIKSNAEYWTNKIERNMARDSKATEELRRLGWAVLRFWGGDIKKYLDACVGRIMAELDAAKEQAGAGAVSWPTGHDGRVVVGGQGTQAGAVTYTPGLAAAASLVAEGEGGEYDS
jgi:DNA mismatch endonuclease (patch repair protein)